MINYVIQSGDSLSKIARDKLGNMALWPEIARINKIKDANKIYPGQIIKLPDMAKPATVVTTQPKTITTKVTDSVLVVPEQKALVIEPKQQTASFGGWATGIFITLLVGGAIYKNHKNKKAEKKG